MNAFNFLSNPVAEALGWTLLHAIWQGFALVLPVAVVLHTLRTKSGLLRYRISAVTLLCQLLASVGTFFWYYQPTIQTQTLPTSTSGYYAARINWQTVAQTLPWHQQVGQFLETHLSQIVLVYLIGVALFGLRLAGGWLYLQRLSQTAMKPVSQQWVEVTNRLQATLSIRAVVRVRESARIAVPMIVGVLKPILLLPLGLATHLSLQEIEAMLAHELAHVKRHDYAVNLLQSVIEVLYFFHPALWWLSARVREEREHCCDDLAVQVCGGNGRILAQALARVEELRLIHQAQAPTLAMAFASKRQHLLHRVRRVLGVPTRPFVSNGSLAGLTLATILLMSISVYAVQQEPQQPKQPKPKSTQRFNGTTSGKQIGYELLDGRLTTIDVNGKRLPKTKVNQIQNQLDRVLTGQLNLDHVSQPNRDILLTIFEKSAGFQAGMDALNARLNEGLNDKLNEGLNDDLNTQGSARIDYNTIIKTALDAANSAGTFPVDVENVLKDVEKIDYNRIIKEAMASVDTNIFFNDDGVIKAGNADAVQRFHSKQMDSLSQLMAQRSQQMQALHLQMEKLRFPVEEVERAKQILEWKKQKLMEQRNTLIEKHQKLLYNDGKQKLSQVDVEKQLSALEPDIKKLESSMEDLNQQMEQSNARQEELRKPMEKLEREAEQLENEVDKLSDRIGEHSDKMIHLVPMVPPTLPSAIRGYNRTPRTPRPARAPSPVIVPAPALPPSARAVPAKPATVPRPKVAPTPPKL